MSDEIPIGLKMMDLPTGESIMPVDVETGRPLGGIIDVCIENRLMTPMRATITFYVNRLFDSNGKPIPCREEEHTNVIPT
jgi:hypothetical protein